MFVVMGARGHVGSEVLKSLLERRQPVTAITHSADHASVLEKSGAEVVVADIEDVDSLRAAFKRGSRAFLLNPPADVKGDTDADELRTGANIAAALEGSGLEKVVLESTAGAMPGDGIGDSSVLWELEQRIAAQPIPAAVNRAAFYMSNWDGQLETVRSGGQLQTMYPADFKLPMVAPKDLGVAAADRLMSTVEDVLVREVEGPQRYSSADVAAAFAAALGRDVEVVTTPPDKFREAYAALGFSREAAEAYSRMTEQTLRSDFDFGDSVIRGETTLQRYIDALVSRRGAA